MTTPAIPSDVPQTPATARVLEHVNELGRRLTAVLDEAERFLPMVASLEREIVRCEEDLLPMKRTETDPEIVGRADGMEQRHRSLLTAATELRRHVNHIFMVSKELEDVHGPFLTAARGEKVVPKHMVAK